MKKLFFIISIFFCSYSQANTTDFITLWDLSLYCPVPGQISFNVTTTGNVSYTWETVPAGSSGSGIFNGSTATITGLPTSGIIRLVIDTSYFRQITFGNGVTNAHQLIDIEQWGKTRWKNMQKAFYGCRNLNITALDLPNLDSVQDMSWMFGYTRSFIGPSNINSWDVSHVTNMEYMFYQSNFNQPIGSWNTSNVTNMSSMFLCDTFFNQQIGNWDVGNVQNMANMFGNDTTFNQPLGNWNTSNVNFMSGLFYHAKAFNQPLAGWNTASVYNMEYMFCGASSFNQSIDNWNVGSVFDMSHMFTDAICFNQPLGNWNTSNCYDLRAMFAGATNFNQPIGNWNTSNCYYLTAMFYGATNFNQPIGNWNTHYVEDMGGVFYNAISFNQPIGNWNLENNKNTYGMFYGASSFNQQLANWNMKAVEDLGHMFYHAVSFNQDISSWQLFSADYFNNMLDSSGMDCINYSSFLSTLASNGYLDNSLTLGAQNLHFGPSAVNARNYLVNSKNWNIVGDIVDSTCISNGLVGDDLLNSISIFPNPLTDFLNIKVKEANTSKMTIAIYNSLSDRLYVEEFMVYPGKQDFQIKTSSFQSGIYFIEIFLGSRRLAKRIEILR